MEGLTARQQQSLDFIQASQLEHGVVPTLREDCATVRLSQHDGRGGSRPRIAAQGLSGASSAPSRSHSVVPALHQAARRPLFNVPLYGSIPAGYAEEQVQESDRSVTVDLQSLGLRSTRKFMR